MLTPLHLLYARSFFSLKAEAAFRKGGGSVIVLRPPSELVFVLLSLNGHTRYLFIIRLDLAPFGASLTA